MARPRLPATGLTATENPKPSFFNLPKQLTHPICSLYPLASFEIVRKFSPVLGLLKELTEELHLRL
jgi:hypothetical protein